MRISDVGPKSRDVIGLLWNGSHLPTAPPPPPRSVNPGKDDQWYIYTKMTVGRVAVGRVAVEKVFIHVERNMRYNQHGHAMTRI